MRQAKGSATLSSAGPSVLPVRCRRSVSVWPSWARSDAGKQQSGVFSSNLSYSALFDLRFSFEVKGYRDAAFVWHFEGVNIGLPDSTG